MALKNKETERANEALKRVNAIKDEDFKEKYCTYAKRLPSLVLTNGLGQTLTFYKSKAKFKKKAEPDLDEKAYREIYQALSEWISKEILKEEGDFLEKIFGKESEVDSATYRRATAEALAFSNWLKRFAEAIEE